MKGLSHEIPIRKVDAVNRAVDKIKIIVMQEYFGFLGVRDLGVLHIVMIQSTWETLHALYTEEVRPTSDNKLEGRNAAGSQITA